MARSTELEVQINGEWKTMNVVDALATNERYGNA
jgi:hypothetical protein